MVPAGDLARIGTLVATGDDALREAAVRAIGTWKVASLQNKLVELVGAADTSRGVRAAAIEALVQNGGARRAPGRRDADRERGAPEVQARVLAALLEADRQGNHAAFRRVARPARARPVERGRDRAGSGSGAAGSARRCWPRLWTSLAPTLSADLAKLCIRQVRASGRDEPGLIAALEKAGRLKEGVKKLSDKEMNQLLTDVARTGDPARGEAIYRRKDLNCQKCHAIAGAGGQVGPGLESIGASAQPDYLVDSLLEPGKAVKENYHALVVATSDGKVYTGIKLRQTDSELVLRDAEDREVAIPTSSIEEQKTAGSLMPAGLTEGLTRPELIDLVRFLSQLGKIGPFSVGTDRVLRRWQVLEATPEVKSAIARSGLEALLSARAVAQLAAGLHDGGGAASALGMARAGSSRRCGSVGTGAEPARGHQSRRGEADVQRRRRALPLGRRPARRSRRATRRARSSSI